MPQLKLRAKDLHELADGAAFLFKRRPLDIDEKAAALLTSEARALLAKISARLHSESDWTVAALEANLKAFAEEQGLGLGKLAQPMRAALTGTTTSPGIFDVLALLGRDEALARLDAQTTSADAGHTV
jgi:glutamyl-tRNA synthetase